jgi:hypothetical protein
VTAYVIFDATSGGDPEAMKPYGKKAFNTLAPDGGKPIHLIMAAFDSATEYCGE